MKIPLFNKVEAWTSNLIKKRLQPQSVPLNIPEFLRTSVLKNFCKWLLLKQEQTHV